MCCNANSFVNDRTRQKEPARPGEKERERERERAVEFVQNLKLDIISLSIIRESL